MILWICVGELIDFRGDPYPDIFPIVSSNRGFWYNRVHGVKIIF